MLERTIRVMNISMQNNSPIFLDVSELYRHSLDRTIEDARVIDVVPSEK